MEEEPDEGGGEDGGVEGVDEAAAEGGPEGEVAGAEAVADEPGEEHLDGGGEEVEGKNGHQGNDKLTDKVFAEDGHANVDNQPGDEGQGNGEEAHGVVAEIIDQAADDADERGLILGGVEGVEDGEEG